MNKGFFVVSCLLLGLVFVAHAEETDKDIYKGSVENRVNALSSIQPGLGVVMHEMGYRLTSMYWAANGGNWGLAQYELKELIEAQEVAEVTRPQRAIMLKDFEKTHLAPLEKIIQKKNISQFRSAFKEVTEGCNACHVAVGYSFIRYLLPKLSSHEVLDFKLKTEPNYPEMAEPK